MYRSIGHNRTRRFASMLIEPSRIAPIWVLRSAARTLIETVLTRPPLDHCDTRPTRKARGLLGSKASCNLWQPSGQVDAT